MKGVGGIAFGEPEVNVRPFAAVVINPEAYSIQRVPESTVVVEVK